MRWGLNPPSAPVSYMPERERLDVSKNLGSYIRYHTVITARDTEETEGSREEKETTGKDTSGRVLAPLPRVNDMTYAPFSQLSVFDRLSVDTPPAAP